MGGTLANLFSYVENFLEFLNIADEYAKKRRWVAELEKVEAIQFDELGDLNLSANERKQMVEVSRILKNYGLEQSYESFKKAAELLEIDFEHTKETSEIAYARLKDSAMILYQRNEYIWDFYDGGNPWGYLLVKLVSDDDSDARRESYRKQLLELGNMSMLAASVFAGTEDSTAISIAPSQLEAHFISTDELLPEILPRSQRDAGLE